MSPAEHAALQVGDRVVYTATGQKGTLVFKDPDGDWCVLLDTRDRDYNHSCGGKLKLGYGRYLLDQPHSVHLWDRVLALTLEERVALTWTEVLTL